MSLEDRAQEHEAVEWAARNASRPAPRLFEPGQEGYGPAFCEECQSTMPALRRAHGWVLCTSCQSAVERGHIRR